LELLGGLGWGGRDHTGHGEGKRAAIVETGVDEHQLGVWFAQAAGLVGRERQGCQVIDARTIRTGCGDCRLDALHVLLGAGGALLGECTSYQAY
jgi:hypothetical protein